MDLFAEIFSQLLGIAMLPRGTPTILCRFETVLLLCLVALFLYALLLEFVKVLVSFVKATFSAVLRHAGTFIAAFVAVLVAIMIYNNGESMEPLKQAFDNSNG